MRCEHDDERQKRRDLRSKAHIYLRYNCEGVEQERYFCIKHFLMELPQMWFGAAVFEPLEIKFTEAVKDAKYGDPE